MSATDWQVTAVTTSTRTVQITAGSGQAYGVRDTTSAVATLALPLNGGGTTRFDVVVATFNWAAGTPTTSFQVITGTTALPSVNTGGSVVAGQINRVPGVQYDAVLAVVPVVAGAGSFSAADVVDSRVWGGHAGPLNIPTATYLSAIDVAQGSQAQAVDTGKVWSYNGSSWVLVTAVMLAGKAVDTSRASTVTLTADPELVLTVAIGVYVLEGRIYASGAGDLSMALTGTATATTPQSFWGGAVPAGTVGPAALTWGSTVTRDSSGNAVAADMPVSVTGTLKVTAAGTVRIDWAQQTSNAAATSLLAGSWLRLTKIG
jgi:hypothetical protein